MKLQWREMDDWTYAYMGRALIGDFKKLVDTECFVVRLYHPRKEVLNADNFDAAVTLICTFADRLRERALSYGFVEPPADRETEPEWEVATIYGTYTVRAHDATEALDIVVAKYLDGSRRSVRSTKPAK
ncbi:hypothetical protein [Asticcacaulis excentricus]|uniref:hypothetical protein n=1 Tax=Asticcacaulis excentricus TaxID=78587 RepID=UPI000F81ED44|nr:hypothetical protein [Asticcacaulis excentricus]